jgi:uncharacterized protein
VPDYVALVKFLVEPMLEQPGSLRIDCEQNSQGDRILIRVAFDAVDKGRVFGRGGRTVHAIRTVVQTAALATSHTVRFEVFDPDPSDRSDRSSDKYSDKYSERSQERAGNSSSENSGVTPDQPVVRNPNRIPIKLKPKE